MQYFNEFKIPNRIRIRNPEKKIRIRIRNKSFRIRNPNYDDLKRRFLNDRISWSFLPVFREREPTDKTET